jgi:hypothetical protein
MSPGYPDAVRLATSAQRRPRAIAMAAGTTPRPVLTPPGHQCDDRVDVVALGGVIGHPIGSGEAAYHAHVDDHQALAGAVVDALWPHQPAAAGRTVAGLDIQVL